MSPAPTNRMYVATRKGLFTLIPGDKGWTIRDTAFLGNPVTIVLKDPRDGALYAGLNLGHFGVKLHRSEDDGKTWDEITCPSFPLVEGADADAKPDGPSVAQLWCLEAGGPDQPGVLWAGTIPGALFRSDDRGATWSLVESLWDRPERKEWFGGGYDQPGIHSICVDPRNSNHVTLGVSCGGVWVTRDGGQNWDCRTAGMFAEYMPPERREDPSIQDPHRMVQSPTDPDTLWVQHHNGAFVSEDGAENWRSLEFEPSTFGFAVAVHPKDPNTAWFVPGVKDECRIPVDGQFVVVRTTDGGKTFTTLRDGLPQAHAYDLVFRHALDVDASGRWLAMGSTTGSLWISDSGGDRWKTLSKHLPPVYQVRFG